MAQSPKAKKTRAAAAKRPAAKKTPAKATAKAKAAPRKRKAAPQAKAEGFDITKLIDHPLVGDLLAVGAMAAVAAIADHNVKTRTGEAEAGSSKVVKAAGKAAAAAIGKRLLTEVDAIRNTAKKPKPVAASKAKKSNR